MSEAPASMDPDDSDPLEFATFHEGYLSRYIQLADAKAGTALVVVAATLAYLLADAGYVGALLLQGAGWASLLALATGTVLAASGAMAFWVIAPRGSAPGDSLIYWNDVSRRRVDEFVAEVRRADPSEIVKQRLAHSHALASISERKYRWLRRALTSGAVGLVLALVCRLAS